MMAEEKVFLPMRLLELPQFLDHRLKNPGIAAGVVPQVEDHLGVLPGAKGIGGEFHKLGHGQVFRLLAGVVLEEKGPVP